MKAVTKAMGKLYKSYLATVILKDLKKLADIDFRRQAYRAQKAIRNIQWDRESMLRKVGLTTYSPARMTLGGALLFLTGAAVGTVAGMALAPTSGEQFRKNLRDKVPMFKPSEVAQTQAPAQA